MGEYVYKVTSKTVGLDNGDQANVALYAYKPFWMSHDAEARNTKLHFTTGAGTCDRNRDKRTGWIVYGHEDDDGTISVGPSAFKIGDRKFGSFNDGAMDYLLNGDEVQHARITKLSRGIRYDGLPTPTHPAVGMLQKADGVAWYAFSEGLSADGYFESRDLAAVERHAIGGPS